jgi:hypothetical protein
MSQMKNGIWTMEIQAKSKSDFGVVSTNQEVKRNWIRKAVLRRLGQDSPTEREDDKERQEVHESTELTSSVFVEFQCPGPQGGKSRPEVSVCRFYVVSHVKFDLLIGRHSMALFGIDG